MSRASAVLSLSLLACTVDRPSDGLRCSTADDCQAGRTCQSGYCVVGATPADVGAASDAPVRSGVQCGTQTCAPDEGCCVGSATCRLISAGCPGGGALLACDDRAECTVAGDVCCAELRPQGDMVAGASCSSFAVCTAKAMHLVLCDPAAPAPCPDGGSCAPITSPAALSTYHACQ